ncbi:MAG: hypothetical protein BWY78_01093 [Alphaproteobacteria bacterium ADurb.Bin438]|nr:MAG: hypothetical protein BWY78_01093 [Alphaproteobacteria bacterium ADurb.Bin438]
MRKFKVNALVRDGRIDIFKNKNIVPDFFTLNHEKIVKLLKSKLVEEANECLNSNNEAELKEELADCIEVIMSIVKHNNFDMSEIENIRKAKQQKIGSFDKGYFLNSVSINETDEKEIEYYLKNSKKYPEI